MLIRDVMTTNVVSIPSTMSLADARRTMDAHQVKHLPVVDKEKLVGIVTKSTLDKAGPSELTTFSKQELNYLLDRLTVKEVMSRDLMTISPGADVKDSVRGGCMLCETGEAVPPVGLQTNILCA